MQLPSWEELSCCQLLMPVFSLAMLHLFQLRALNSRVFPALPSPSQLSTGPGRNFLLFKIIAVGEVLVGKSCSWLGGNLPFPMTGHDTEQGKSTGSSVVLSQKSSDGQGSTGMDRVGHGSAGIHSSVHVFTAIFKSM